MQITSTHQQWTARIDNPIIVLGRLKLVEE
jgi:hypothetical protein